MQIILQWMFKPGGYKLVVPKDHVEDEANSDSDDDYWFIDEKNKGYLKRTTEFLCQVKHHNINAPLGTIYQKLSPILTQQL